MSGSWKYFVNYVNYMDETECGSESVNYKDGVECSGYHVNSHLATQYAAGKP